MDIYIYNLALFAFAHFAAVLSPGPDMAIVLRHSLQSGTKSCIIASFGVASGHLVHIAYVWWGMNIFSQWPTVMKTIQILGGLYLIYLSILIARELWKNKFKVTNISKIDLKESSKRKIYTSAFLADALNPNTTIFFISISTAFISSDWSETIRAAFLSVPVILSAVWFSALAWLINREKVKSKYEKAQPKIDFIISIFLLFVGTRIMVG